MVSQLKIHRSTLILKINVFKLIQKYPKLMKSSVTLTFLKNYLKDTKQIWASLKKTLYKQYLFGLFFSYRPKYTSSFLICPNPNDWQTFKRSSCKNSSLQCVFYRCNLLPWTFFVPCDSWKTLFFLKVCRYYEIFSNPVLSFSLKQVFWKKSVFYAISTKTV